MDMYGVIYAAVVAEDDIDTTAEAAFYATQGRYVFPVTEAQFPNVQDAVTNDTYFVDVEFMALVARPAKPGDGYVWDGPGQSWVISEEDWSIARNGMKLKLANAYSLNKSLPFLFETYQFSCTDSALIEIRSVVSQIEEMAQMPTNWTGWRTVDGARLPMLGTLATELARAKNILAAARSRRATLVSIYYNHLDSIDSAATIAAINAYDVNTQWPT